MGGVHLYWKLKKTFYIRNKEYIKKWETYLRRLCYAMDGDRSCAEIARILRVPYTPNFKYHHKPIVKIAKETDNEYDLGEIVKLLPPEKEIPKNTRSVLINWDMECFIEKAYAAAPYHEGPLTLTRTDPPILTRTRKLTGKGENKCLQDI